MSATANNVAHTLRFTEAEARLWNLLKNGAACNIGRLARAADPECPDGLEKRHLQRRVAAHVSRMNLKLAKWGYIINPGGPRFTYQLRRAAKS